MHNLCYRPLDFGFGDSPMEFVAEVKNKAEAKKIAREHRARKGNILSRYYIVTTEQVFSDQDDV